ncbi:MAG: glycosyl transferase [Sphingobacterium sp.]|jgi:mannosyltransferase OCH1-like enzyme|nr:glycosyl transferase [Sphingobacterium sp.]
MSIPKVIYQTFKTTKIPFLTRFYIWMYLKKNKGWKREFYDDERVDVFFRNNFDDRTYAAYSRLQIGAAKADFFRYAVLYVYGGVYLDMDSDILVSLDKHIREDDMAFIAREKNHPDLFAQWGLIYAKGHPFLKRTIAYIIENIEENKYPNDVHKMTGPTVYTKAIEDEIKDNPNVSYRLAHFDYKGILQFKYKLGKILLYKDRANHWKKLQQRITVLKPE